MKKILTAKMASNLGYAVALAAAALSGSAMAIAMSAQAHAQAGKGVSLTSKAMVERTVKAANGSETTIMKSPKDVIVTPGDTVVFTLTYVNQGSQPATGFRATNPMPSAIRFIEAAESFAVVSADGGTTFGKLGELQVTELIEEDAVYDEDTGKKISDAVSENRTRLVSAADVTHVRWVFANAIAPGAKGSVSYRGVVK